MAWHENGIHLILTCTCKRHGKAASDGRQGEGLMVLEAVSVILIPPLSPLLSVSVLLAVLVPVVVVIILISVSIVRVVGGIRVCVPVLLIHRICQGGGQHVLTGAVFGPFRLCVCVYGNEDRIS